MIMLFSLLARVWRILCPQPTAIMLDDEGGEVISIRRAAMRRHPSMGMLASRR